MTKECDIKKKIFSFLLANFGLFLLTACGNQNSLEGKYYWINDDRNDYILEIKDDKGNLNSEGGYSFTVDKEKKEFRFEGFINPTVKYEYSPDGKLTVNLMGMEQEFYKEGSKSYNEALKKYGYDKKD